MRAPSLNVKFISGGKEAEKLKEKRAATHRAESVGMVILAGVGIAEVAIRQRIGCSLRAKKDGPNVCFMLDFENRFNNHLMHHSAQRKAIIMNTPGFDEGVVDEFPYHLFETSK